MINIRLFSLLMVLGVISCDSSKKEENHSDTTTYPDLGIAGAMKNVMWNGELDGVISLDSIAGNKGWYGLGPESFLTGELLINDGKSYVSRVLSDSTMSVERKNNLSAPFFVYGKVEEWIREDLPQNIKTIPELDQYIDKRTQNSKRPFAFKLAGTVNKAVIHIQNLPEGTQVSSPDEAHQGQVSYPLENEKVEIIGFFSTTHAGIFIHHDSHVHMHLISEDEKKMGHLDELEIDRMELFLPIK